MYSQRAGAGQHLPFVFYKVWVFEYVIINQFQSTDYILLSHILTFRKIIMRQVVIHYHIFKNAGSTIDSVFKRKFKNGYASIDGSTPGGTLETEYLLQYAENHPKIKVISSHQCRPPVPVSNSINFHPILFLRHPIDRVGSVYLFEKNQPSNGALAGVKMAQKNDLAEYVKWRLAKNNGAVIKNFQTIYLSGREKEMKTAQATRADLETAIERLNNLDFFGIVELFDESVTRMKKYLSRHFGMINTVYSVQNKSQGRKPTLAGRLDDLRNSLSTTLFDELIDKNSLDLELYDAALELFKARAV
jgi:hypothetical protein